MIQKKRSMHEKSVATLLMRLAKITNIVLMTSIVGMCWHFVYEPRLQDPFYKKMEVFIFLTFMLLYALFGRIYEGFHVSLVRIRSVVYSQAIAICLVDVFAFLLAVLLEKSISPVTPIIVTYFLQLVISVVWAIFANKLYFYTSTPMLSGVLYYDERDYKYLVELKKMSGRFLIKKWIRVTGKVEPFLSELEDLDVVFVRGIPSEEKNTVLKYCIARDIEVYQYPKIGDILMSGAEHLQLFHNPVMRVYRYNPPIEYLIIKRTLDILLSLIGLVVLSPVFIITSIAIKMYDGDKVFYKQVRLTKDGKEFQIYKFRSMCPEAEQDGIARLAQEGDSRITPVGRIIRAVRIDELPQLLNVLKGEMSLVGPRPERPEIAEQYLKEMPEFSLRLQVKAGITGYAQIYGKYNTSPYDKLQMDLIYIARPSIVYDLQLLLGTVKILLTRESTQGIKKGSLTAYPVYKGETENEIQCGDSTL